MSTNWQPRLDILRRDVERKILEPLRTHAWKAAIEQETGDGEYLIVSAERGGHRHVIAILYTSATDNAIYKRLTLQVENIFVNGDLYMLDSFAYGLNKPVSKADDFHTLLLQWNQGSSEGKFAPIPPDSPPIAVGSRSERILSSEEPIQAIWLRLRQFQSVSLAKKLVEARAQKEGIDLDSRVIRSKAEGVAYSLRNASDYFQTKEVRNLSQRILNLYYGSMAFATAEMLALPKGQASLAEIEKHTKQGHGLYVLDGPYNGLDHLMIGVNNQGFFPAWMKSINLDVSHFPSKKATDHEKLMEGPPTSWLPLERLFASIPEISDLFSEIFPGKPRWVTFAYAQTENRLPNGARTYVRFIDNSARLTKEDIAEFPGPISEIAPVNARAGSHFRVAISHPENVSWWSVLQEHHSPFQRHALILPIFGVVNEYRAICLALLYSLSIVVRYRPSVWRLAQEGDLDHMRVLIEAFLAVVERVLPEQFLETVTGQRVFARQPGASW